MKLYFMKKEALEILKDNLDLVYNKYFTEKDNKWLWTVCGGDPFVEYKDVPDFQLSMLRSDISIGEVEFNNNNLSIKKGDLLFIPANEKNIKWSAERELQIICCKPPKNKGENNAI